MAFYPGLMNRPLREFEMVHDDLKNSRHLKVQQSMRGDTVIVCQPMSLSRLTYSRYHSCLGDIH